MKRTGTILTAAFGTTAVAASAVVLASTGSAAAGTPRAGSFTVHLHQTSDTRVDLGTKGFSAGDQEVGAANITRNGRRIGWANMSCTTARVGQSSADEMCDYVLHLGAAQITAAGSVRAGQHGPGTFHMPIVGGTGRYRGAAGQLAITATSGSTLPITIQLGN